jgi:hypothetical protein
MASTTPKRILILPQPEGDVVARYTELGRVVGGFHQIPTGEIYFGYHGESRRWYANRSITAFTEAAGIFNRYCQVHADDEDTDDEAAWSLVAAKLKREFESVEPLGDPGTSIWSATIHDTESGLLSLY